MPARTVSSARTTFAWAIWGCSRRSTPASLSAANQWRAAPLPGTTRDLPARSPGRRRPRSRRDDPPDDRPIGEIRVDHVQATARPGDGVIVRGAIGRCRSPGLLRRTSNGTRPRSAGREEPVEIGRGLRQRAALEVPRQEEDRLELGDDRALDPEHHVVEPLVVEMVLDARGADVGDAAVNDDDLAMVELAQVVETPVDPPAAEPSRRGRGTRPGWPRPGPLLPSTRSTACVSRGRAGCTRVDHQSDGHPLANLLMRRSRKRSPISPGLKPKMMMWTSERAASMSASIRGKKDGPSISNSHLVASAGVNWTPGAFVGTVAETASTSDGHARVIASALDGPASAGSEGLDAGVSSAMQLYCPVLPPLAIRLMGGGFDRSRRTSGVSTRPVRVRWPRAPLAFVGPSDAEAPSPPIASGYPVPEQLCHEGDPGCR